jgi:hypothetical protein
MGTEDALGGTRGPRRVEDRPDVVGRELGCRRQLFLRRERLDRDGAAAGCDGSRQRLAVEALIEDRRRRRSPCGDNYGKENFTGPRTQPGEHPDL